jgi:hypothetical protein
VYRSSRIDSHFQPQPPIRSDPISSPLTPSSIALLRRARKRLPISDSQPSIDSFYFTDLHPDPDIAVPILIYHPP